MYENRDKWRREYWLQLHKFRERGEKEVLGCPWQPPPLSPSLQALLLSKQPTVFGWPKLFSTLCLTQSDPLLKNPGDTREFITSDYLCVLTVFLNSTSRVVSLPQPGRLHFTINRSQSCIEEVVKDEDDSEIQVYINTNFVFWKLVDTSFLVINGTLWNFVWQAWTSVTRAQTTYQTQEAPKLPQRSLLYFCTFLQRYFRVKLSWMQTRRASQVLFTL